MAPSRPIPLDLRATEYSYVERPNSVLIDMVCEDVIGRITSPRILDVGCGAGANARVIRERCPNAVLVGIEPNRRAAELAKQVMDRVVVGSFDDWFEEATQAPFDGVILSDVVEHVADPVAFLKKLAAAPALEQARVVISVPNYAVWYNRLKTLAGRFDYAWSGLYDRTHLRFYTRQSLKALLAYSGFEVTKERVTPSLVQSAAPILRRFFERDVAEGDHLSLTESPAFQFYRRFVEPAEARACGVWPGLFGFQIVCLASRRGNGS